MATRAVNARRLRNTRRCRITGLNVRVDLIRKLMLTRNISMFLRRLLTRTIKVIYFNLPRRKNGIMMSQAFTSTLRISRPQLIILCRGIATLRITMRRNNKTTARRRIYRLLRIIFRPIFLRIRSHDLRRTMFGMIRIPRGTTTVRLYLQMTMKRIRTINSNGLCNKRRASNLTRRLFLFLARCTNLTTFLSNVR